MASRLTTDNAAAAHEADVVVLSVKPQRLSEVMKGLKSLRPDALILSIVAGASIEEDRRGFEAQSHCAFDAEYTRADRGGDHGLGCIGGDFNGAA